MCMETFDLHEQILCVSAGGILLLLCIHIVNNDDFCGPYSMLMAEVKKYNDCL